MKNKINYYFFILLPLLVIVGSLYPMHAENELQKHNAFSTILNMLCIVALALVLLYVWQQFTWNKSSSKSNPSKQNNNN